MRMKKHHFLISVSLSFVIGLMGCGMKKKQDAVGPSNGDAPSVEEVKGKSSGWNEISTVGNGGGVIACRGSDGSISLKTLNLFEAEILRNFTPQKLSDQTTPEVIIDQILNNLALKDSDLAAYYRIQLNKFNQQLKYIPDIRLPVTDDSGRMFVVPKNCMTAQLALQAKPQFEGDVVYVIDKDLWDRLDNFNKASAILHEVIYRDALARGHKDSYATRYLSGLITSEQLTAMPISTYVETVLSLKLPGGTGTQGVVTYSLDSKIERDANGQIIKITTSTDEKRQALVKMAFAKEPSRVNGGTSINFYPTGELESASLANIDFYDGNWDYTNCRFKSGQTKEFYTYFDQKGLPIKIDGRFKADDYDVRNRHAIAVCLLSNMIATGPISEESIGVLLPQQSLEFYPGSLVLKKIQFAIGQSYELAMSKKCYFKGSNHDIPGSLIVKDFVEFSLKSNILKARAAFPALCDRADGTKKDYAADDVMTFDEEGYSLD